MICISSNIEEVSQSTQLLRLSFETLTSIHKDWLTYSRGTDRPGELCYNFSISNDLTQMVNFPTSIPDCDSHSPAVLHVFIYSNASICSILAFSPLGNSDHVFVSIFIDFPINSKQDALFHRITYDCSRADWDTLCDHLRDVPGGLSLNSVLLLKLVNFGIGFKLQLIYTSLIISIRSNLSHLHGFQLLVLLPYRINLLNLK